MGSVEKNGRERADALYLKAWRTKMVQNLAGPIGLAWGA